MITHVKFVSIPATDQDRALAFYTEKLGFSVVTDQAFGPKQRWIEMSIASSPTRFVLFTTADGPQPGHRFNGSLACDDVEKTYEQLSALGVHFDTPPTKQPWGTFAILKDSEGNSFVLSST